MKRVWGSSRPQIHGIVARMRFAAATAFYRMGSSAGLNEALAAAIRLYEQALAAAPRDCTVRLGHDAVQLD